MELEAEFGDITLVLDEVYSEIHKFKFMGFKMESKKSIRVLGALIDVTFPDLDHFEYSSATIKTDQ